MALSDRPIEGKPRSVFINKKCNEILDARFLRFPKWRDQEDNFQNIRKIYRFRLFNYLQNITYLLFLEEFARAIMSIKSSLNNPDAFDKWMENEEIEFKEPPIQEDTENTSTSRSSRRPYVRLITFNVMLYYFSPFGKVITNRSSYIYFPYKWCF